MLKKWFKKKADKEKVEEQKTAPIAQPKPRAPAPDIEGRQIANEIGHDSLRTQTFKKDGYFSKPHLMLAQNKGEGKWRVYECKYSSKKLVVDEAKAVETDFWNALRRLAEYEQSSYKKGMSLDDSFTLSSIPYFKDALRPHGIRFDDSGMPVRDRAGMMLDNSFFDNRFEKVRVKNLLENIEYMDEQKLYDVAIADENPWSPVDVGGSDEAGYKWRIFASEVHDLQKKLDDLHNHMTDDVLKDVRDYVIVDTTRFDGQTGMRLQRLVDEKVFLGVLRAGNHYLSDMQESGDFSQDKIDILRKTGEVAQHLAKERLNFNDAEIARVPDLMVQVVSYTTPPARTQLDAVIEQQDKRTKRAFEQDGLHNSASKKRWGNIYSP